MAHGTGGAGWRVASLALAASVVSALASSSGPALAQADRLLWIYPIPSAIPVGASADVAAFLCPRQDVGLPYGDDGAPGTGDDDCSPADAQWTTHERRIATVAPKRGAEARVSGRKVGETIIEASLRLSRSLSVSSQVQVRVVEETTEPGPGEDVGGEPPPGGEPGDRRPEGPPTTIVADPQFVELPPNADQVFVAYRCPLLDAADPRGPDMSPGSQDDFCRLVDATWELVGQDVGTLDPDSGPFAILHTANDETDEARLAIAAGLMSIRAAAVAGPLMASEARSAISLPEDLPSTGSAGIVAMVDGMTGSASVVVDAAVPAQTRRLGDSNGDGSVGSDDLEPILRAFGSSKGQGRYVPEADVNSDMRIDAIEVLVHLFIGGS